MLGSSSMQIFLGGDDRNAVFVFSPLFGICNSESIPGVYAVYKTTDSSTTLQMSNRAIVEHLEPMDFFGLDIKI
jgi:hypothetical protein